MSKLSFIEKLLGGVEVEWPSFGEVAKIQRGASPRPIAKYITEGENGVPWIKIGDTRAGSKYVDNTVQRITPEGAKKSRILSKGDFILSNSMSFGRPYILNISGAIHDGWASISNFSEKLNSDYLYHYLSSHNVQNYWLSKINSGSVSNLNADLIKTLPIPIPCPDNPEKSLSIQTEIVRILDAFTAMTTELTTELSMRKKQYNYYRDQLLSFEEGKVEWKVLGDIGKFTYGYAAKAQDTGDARFVRITDINTNGKLSPVDQKYVDISDENEKYILKKDDLLMARTGATFGKTMIFEEDCPAIYAGFLIKLSLDKQTINPKYYWHFAQSDLFWDQANKLVSGGGQPQFNANALKQVKLPVPYPDDVKKSLSVQADIVSTLDKFDAIASSLSEGLPREIELRQKQYEYYRDLLLNFPKPNLEEVA